MPTVYKYPVPITPDGIFELALPFGAKILSVGIQEKGLAGQPEPGWEEIVLWAEILVSMERKEVRRFLCVNTGDSYADSDEFIGTVTSKGGIVWHLFELEKPS